MPKSVDELEAEIEAPRAGLDELGHANAKRRRDALDRVMQLGRRSGPVGKLVLARLDVEENPYVLSRALRVAGAIALEAEASPALGKFLAHADARVVANAVEALADCGDRAHVEAVRPLSGHAVARVRANAVVYLAGVAGFDAAAALKAMIAGRDAGARRSALWAVGRLGLVDVELVRPALRARDPEVVDRARRLVEGWAAKGDAPARKLLAALDGDSVAEQLELRVPTLAQRAQAWLMDSVLLGALATLALLVVVRLDPARGALRVKVQLVMLAHSIAFFMRDGLGGGRGLGKRYVGLRVVDVEKGTGCGFLESMIRQATFYLPFVNVCEVVWASVDPDGCRIVDRLLGTMVVDEKARASMGLDRTLLTVCALAFAVASGGVTVLAFAGRLGIIEEWIVP